MIQLRRLTGKSPTSAEPIDCGQQEILYKGRRIGVLADGSGAWALIHETLASDELATIELVLAEAIAPRHLAGIRQLPPPPQQPPGASNEDL